MSAASPQNSNPPAGRRQMPTFLRIGCFVLKGFFLAIVALILLLVCGGIWQNFTGKELPFLKPLWKIAGLSVLCILFGVTFLVGTSLLLYALAILWKALVSKTWPVTDGKVIVSGMESEVRDFVVQGGLEQTVNYHDANVVYEYTVGGERYTSSAVSVGDVGAVRFGFLKLKAAVRIISRYPTGEHVPVFYKPSAPQEAVLEPGVPYGYWSFLAGVAVCFPIGLFGLLWTFGLVAIPLGVFLPVMLGGVSLLIAVPMTCLGVHRLWTAAAAKGWPTAEGRVISSSVQKVVFSDPDRNIPGTQSYQAKVIVQYDVDGKPYASETLSFGLVSHPQSLAREQEVVARYPEGKTVTVFYDPAKPQRSVIEPGVGWSDSILFFVGLPIVLMGVAAIFFGTR